MAMNQLPGVADIARPLVDALLKEMNELQGRRDSIGVELRNKQAIVVSFRTPLLSERDLGRLLSLRADEVPPFDLFVVHDPVGVRVELLIGI